ncbi:hypothetical protein [Haliangium sp.]|uniref:hypothetical protein n=1 Tax=Haliangium sp. TaxID=2663208 RepID=UPI003D09B907
MRSSRHLLLGTLTAWPLVYMVLFIASIVLTPMEAIPMDLLFTVHGATMLLTFGLLAYYLVHALRSPMPSNERLLWAILLVMGGMLTMPIYWYLHIWPSAPTLRHKEHYDE